MDVWTTAEVARLAGVSARTLRHYDAIGLLAPASQGPGGLRRYYTDEPRFKATYDEVGDGFAEYMRAAMNAYAEANL